MTQLIHPLGIPEISDEEEARFADAFVRAQYHCRPIDDSVSLAQEATLNVVYEKESDCEDVQVVFRKSPAGAHEVLFYLLQEILRTGHADVYDRFYGGDKKSRRVLLFRPHQWDREEGDSGPVWGECVHCDNCGDWSPDDSPVPEIDALSDDERVRLAGALDYARVFNYRLSNGDAFNEMEVLHLGFTCGAAVETLREEFEKQGMDENARVFYLMRRVLGSDAENRDLYHRFFGGLEMLETIIETQPPPALGPDNLLFRHHPD